MQTPFRTRWLLVVALVVAAGAWFFFGRAKAPESEVTEERPGHAGPIRRLTGAERNRKLADGPKEIGPADVRGDVTSPDGVPMENAQVSLWHRASPVTVQPDGTVGRADGARVAVLSRYTLVTAADGTFHTEKIPAGAYTLRVTADGFLPGPVQALTLEPGPNGPFHYQMGRGVGVRGVVLDDHGQPVPHVRVWLRPELKHPELFDPEAVRERMEQHSEGMSGADGTFSVQVAAAGAYVLRLHPPEDFVPLEQMVKAPAEHVELHLARGGFVEGVVVDSQHTPLARVSVGVSAKNGERVNVLDSKVTDAQGHFRLHGAPDGTVELEAAQQAADTKLRRSIKKSITVSNHQSPFVELVLGGGAHVTGSVVDGQKQGLAGAHVSAKGNDGTAEGVTDAEGKFSLELPPGKYQLTADLARYHGEPATAEADGAAVTLSLKRSAAIKGHVTSWDHKPLEQLTVDGQSVDSGSDGHFEIERRGYMHSVLVSAKGYAPLTRALPSSDEGEEKNAALAEVDLGEIVLGAGRTVSGNVVDATRNQPAAGATVRVVSGTGVMDRADFGLRRGGPAQTRADAQGHYTLQVDEGDTYLEASDGRHRSSVQAIARGQEVADFRLEEGASLSGRVAGANGAPLAGTMVVAAGKESSGRATTDASGHFEINGLSEGDYGVTASGPSSGNAATAFKRVHVPGSGSVSVDLKPEGSTTLDVHVSGGGGGLIILVLTGGDGAKGVDGMQTQSCQSGAACQVEGVAPGPHLLTVKQGEASASQSVDVQGAGTQVVSVTVK